MRVILLLRDFVTLRYYESIISKKTLLFIVYFFCLLETILLLISFRNFYHSLSKYKSFFGLENIKLVKILISDLWFIPFFCYLLNSLCNDSYDSSTKLLSGLILVTHIFFGILFKKLSFEFRISTLLQSFPM